MAFACVLMILSSHNKMFVSEIYRGKYQGKKLLEYVLLLLKALMRVTRPLRLYLYTLHLLPACNSYLLLLYLVVSTSQSETSGSGLCAGHMVNVTCFFNFFLHIIFLKSAELILARVVMLKKVALGVCSSA